MMQHLIDTLHSGQDSLVILHAEIYADYISDQAYDLLIDANIKVRYGKKVDHATFLDIWKRLGEGE